MNPSFDGPPHVTSETNILQTLTGVKTKTMTVWSYLSTIFGWHHILRILGVGLLSVVLTTILILNDPASAAPSNQMISFSARLKNASGGVVPDGHYNIDFKIYNQASGGSSVWAETYHDANGTSPGQDNRVRVVNGYFSVKLGELQQFENVNWNSDLWMTMNIGGTEQTATVGSIDWDGEMSPRIQLSAVPYSMNSNAVGGKSADQLVQLGQGTQTDASDNSSIAINKTGAGDLINLQANGTDVFTLNKSGDITLGSASDHSITVGSASSGVGHNLTLSAGSTSDNAAGGRLTLQGGDSSGLAAGGDIYIDSGSGNTGGNIVLGGTNASLVDIGNDSSVTTVKGSLRSNSMILGDNSQSTEGEIKIESGTGYFGLLRLTAHSMTSDNIYYLPDESGTICLQSSNNCGFLRTSSLEAQDGSVWVNGGGTFGGDLTVRTVTDSANAMRVQTSEGKLVLGVDTSNQRVSIGSVDTTATLLVLDTKTDEGDPTGVNGAMYYNSDRGKMRCFENGHWENCLSNTKGVPTTQTENYTADYGDFVIADSTTGAFTVTLPEPRAGAVISVKKINAGNTIVVDGGDVNIDNSTLR